MGSEATRAAEALNWAVSSTACPPRASPHPVLTLTLRPHLRPLAQGPRQAAQPETK